MLVDLKAWYPKHRGTCWPWCDLTFHTINWLWRGWVTRSQETMKASKPRKTRVMSWKQGKNSNKLTLVRRQSSLSVPWGLLAEHLLLGAMTLHLDIREIIVVSQEVLRNHTERSHIPFPSGNILHNYSIKSHQETDIGIIHRPYSDFTSFYTDSFACVCTYTWGFPRSSVGKEPAWNIGDLGWIPGSGRSPGEGNGNPFQDSCLKSPIYIWPLNNAEVSRNPLHSGKSMHNL